MAASSPAINCSSSFSAGSLGLGMLTERPALLLDQIADGLRLVRGQHRAHQADEKLIHLPEDKPNGTARRG